MDPSFLYTYKGTIYPIDFKDEKCITYTKPIRSLVDVCSLKIVQDASSTRRAVQVIPQVLYLSLMKAALDLTKDRSIEVLISSWPWSVLTLRKFVPDLFDTPNVLYDDAELASRIRHGVKYTTCLAHTFVECLKKRAPTKLRCLDLTGYPAVEVIVNYLSSHVLLVYNETRQREIITMYNDVISHLPHEKKQQYKVDSTLPDETYMICVDAVLQTNDTLMELCKALRFSSMDHSRFKIKVKALDLTDLGVTRVSVLLDQVDKEYLCGLCLKYNSLNCEGFAVLSQYLSALFNLTALDLSCNRINLTKDITCNLVAETFSKLECLVRLDLSNNRVRNRLWKILQGLRKPLEYTRLCGCGISELDLTYLTTSHHSTRLRELDLSDNSLGGSKFERLSNLLKAVSDSLIVLELEDCGFGEDDLNALFDLAPSMKALRLWNIARNFNISCEMLKDKVTQFVSMPSLKFLKCSFPREFDNDEDPEENETNKLTFYHTLSSMMRRSCDSAGRTHIKILMVSSS